MRDYSKSKWDYIFVMTIDSPLIELKGSIYSFSNGECTPHCE